MAVGQHEDEIVARPLNPPLSRTLALIQHRSKPSDPALEIVREAVLGLRKVEKAGAKSSSKRRLTRPTTAQSRRPG
jgi:hypothetical protein